MSVSTDVTLEVVKSELVAAAEYATAAGLVLDTSSLSEENLRFYVKFENRDAEPFFLEFDCREYPLHPPNLEFVSEARSERGTKSLYPNGFHSTPCICMRYSRKAYRERGGPHEDWLLVDWKLPTSQGVGIDTFAMMLSDLHSKISQSSGRMA